MIQTFYDILEDALRGKKVRLRSYENEEWSQVIRENEDDAAEKIIAWDESKPYVEWVGTVEKLMGGDNSHVDVVFREDMELKTPGPVYYKHLFNNHMFDYIEIID